VFGLLVVDITESVVKRQRMMQQAAALERSPNAELVVDVHTRKIVYANAAAVQLSKAPSTEAVLAANLVTDVLPSLNDHLQILPSAISSASGNLTASNSSGAYAWTGRSELVCLNGDKVNVDMTITAIPHADVQDDGMGFIALSIRDISGALRSEAELSAAKQANAAKTAFLSNMSHEIRTPLNGIIGYTQILQLQQDLSLEHREYLRGISHCSQVLLTRVHHYGSTSFYTLLTRHDFFLNKIITGVTRNFKRLVGFGQDRGQQDGFEHPALRLVRLHRSYHGHHLDGSSYQIAACGPLC
jgi:signal transduction histidine kinase